MPRSFSVLFCIAAAVALGGCGGSTPPAPRTAGAAPQEAVSHVGDITIRATALPTSMLADEVADRYGLVRDDRSVMLLVAVRRGPEGRDVAVPARVSASATRLGGQRQEIALRELRSDDLLDHVGTVEVSPPDTVRFDVTVVREDGASSTMQFTREFYPR